MKRSPLPRYTRLARTAMKQYDGKPLDRRRKPRSRSEFARIYGSKARVQWVKSLPCLVCASAHPLFGVVTAGTSHNAHTVTGGTGRKAGYETIVPLCASHHRRYDEHQAPLDTEAARDALKDAAAGVEAAWRLRCAA